MSKVLIAGGTGMIGMRLSHLLKKQGHEVAHLSRSAPSNHPFPVYEWDIAAAKIDPAAFANTSFVINLAGAGIADKPWTNARKKVIIDSRVNSTRLLKKYIEQHSGQINAFLSASAIGFYGDRGEESVDENSAAGKGFLSESVLAWEGSIKEVAATGVRTVALRIGLVLSTEGGALPKIAMPLKFGAGSYFGNGKQWWSWAHIDDICGMFMHAMNKETMSGFYNAVGPNPVRSKELVKGIQEAKNQAAVMIPVPSFALRMTLGEMADTILFSTKVKASKIQDAGYTFQHPELIPALQHLFKEGI
jgi:uncharacterized protein (TIGR01777 family)